MHTLLVIVIGLIALALCTFAGYSLGGVSGTSVGALVFLPVWLLGAAVNLYLGVRKAGYSLADEAPIFLIVFAVPAAVALFAWWRYR
jgi:hypothetical protein